MEEVPETEPDATAPEPDVTPLPGAVVQAAESADESSSPPPSPQQQPKPKPEDDDQTKPLVEAAPSSPQTPSQPSSLGQGAGPRAEGWVRALAAK